jgi:hypothetical protein
MPQSILQLVSWGTQDATLTANPTVSFWKSLHKRYSQFALDTYEQTFSGQPDWNKRAICNISRLADLLWKTYVQVDIPDVTINASSTSEKATGFRWLDYLGHILLREIEVHIGGTMVDRHYGLWLHVWNEMTQSAGHHAGYMNMIGNTPDLTTMRYIYKDASGNYHSNDGPVNNSYITVKGKRLYIPLQFWFCRHTGAALPLVALQFHDVRIHCNFAYATDCYWAGTRDDMTSPTSKWTTDMGAVRVGSLTNASMLCTYVNLDAEERKRFATKPHEYLIDQLQGPNEEATSQSTFKMRLTLNHPVKSLYFLVRKEQNLEDSAETFGKQHFNFTDDNESGAMSDITGGAAGGGYQSMIMNAFYGKGENPIQSAKLQLNNQDRTIDHDGRYYNLVQPYQCHTNTPSKGVNVYSFALQPESFQPNGSCNFSRIDNTQFVMKLTDKTVKYVQDNGVMVHSSCLISNFAVNINSLKIVGGMGGVTWAS